MTNEERMLREKLGITDPLQVLPVNGSNIPTEKIQKSFMTKISDDFLNSAINEVNLTKHTINRNTIVVNKSSEIPSVNPPSPKINGQITDINKQNIEIKKDDNNTFSQRFKEAQRKIQLEETHRIIPAHNPLVKLK